MEGKGGLKELFFGFMDMLAKWMALSGLLLLGCIPVVTAGASWAAAYYTAVKAVRRHRSGIWDCYWHSFRQNLKQGIVFSLIMLAVGGLLVFYRFAISGVEVFSALYFGLVVLLAVVFLAVLVWLFPLLSRYDMTAGRLLASSVLLAAGHPLRTIGGGGHAAGGRLFDSTAAAPVLLLPVCTAGGLLPPGAGAPEAGKGQSDAGVGGRPLVRGMRGEAL